MTETSEKQDATWVDAGRDDSNGRHDKADIGSTGDAAPRGETAGAADGGRPKEIGGRPGPDPTRYGDWEKNGRCIDF